MDPQHHFYKCGWDCLLGGAAIVLGWVVSAIGWVDGILPEFMKWGGGILIAYRLIQAFIIEPRQNK